MGSQVRFCLVEARASLSSAIDKIFEDSAYNLQNKTITKLWLSFIKKLNCNDNIPLNINSLSKFQKLLSEIFSRKINKKTFDNFKKNSILSIAFNLTQAVLLLMENRSKFGAISDEIGA